jgi:hypothetical protein
MRTLRAFATIARESQPVRRRERGESDHDGSDLAWLFAALPIAAFLAWLVVAAQR